MPTLQLALDPVVAARVLGDVLAARGEVTPSLTSVTVWRHRPGRRCLIGYSFGRGDAPARTVLGKVRAKGADARTYRLQRHLWHHGFGPWAGAGVEVPEPLGLTPELGAWWQRRVAGVDGMKAVWGPDGVETCRRFASAIHALHGASPPVAVRRHGPHDELAILETRLAALADERPGWGARLEALLADGRRLAASLGPRPERLVHRDFYPDQVLAGADRCYLLDLDLCALGDPALDVGNFAAHLVEHALRTWGEPGRAEAAMDAFVDRYLELAGPGHRSAVEAYTTLSLMRLVQIAWTKPERRPHAWSLLEACEARLRGRSRSRPAPSAPAVG
jgi:aminoglycoside phosphotransferase (APT) family kinase protein